MNFLQLKAFTLVINNIVKIKAELVVSLNSFGCHLMFNVEDIL